MAVPLGVLGVPSAGNGEVSNAGAAGASSLDFAVSGAGNRLEGLMISNLATAGAAEATKGTTGGAAGDARGDASEGGERGGFVVKGGPASQVRRCRVLWAVNYSNRSA